MAKTNFLGHDKEPPQERGGKGVGRKPWIHSHSARRKTTIKGGGRKRGMMK